MGHRTPLFAEHARLGARIVPFGGWDMPLHYGSQIEEHLAVRSQAGIFDVSHMRTLDITGNRARDLLRRLLANDVARLREPGKALYSCMLSERGGVLDDLIVYFRGPDSYRVVVNAATADKDLAWMRTQAQGQDVAIQPRTDLAMIAIQGPEARRRAAPHLPLELREPALALQPFFGVDDRDWFVARTGYTGEDGFEILLPADQAAGLWRALVAGGVVPCGLGARDTLRLEAGMNLYGQDMDEDTNPLESGLDWTLAWEPRRPGFHRPRGLGGAPDGGRIEPPGRPAAHRAGRPARSSEGAGRRQGGRDHHLGRLRADLAAFHRSGAPGTRH